MKNLLLTGLSTDFDIRTNETSFCLIFNGGELRIPVSEQAAEVALAVMAEEEGEETPKQGFDWSKEEELGRLRSHEEGTPSYSYQPYNGADEPQVDTGDVAIDTRGLEHVDWDATPTEGAEIYSASDYDNPPDYAATASQVDIDDGVSQL